MTKGKACTGGQQERRKPYAAIPLRFIVGYGFLARGLAKWLHGPETFAGILGATGVPSPHVMAWVKIFTEIVAGAAFLIGAFVPLVGIPSIILLAVAIRGDVSATAPACVPVAGCDGPSRIIELACCGPCWTRVVVCVCGIEPRAGLGVMERGVWYGK